MTAGGPLYQRYIGNGDAAEVAAVRGLFCHDPADPIAAARARAEAVATEYKQDRGPLVDALVRFNTRIGASPAAIAALGRLRDPRALAVVTGQQAGLFTGPLYTLLKAAGAVAVARRLETELARPVVPIFWAATEDHDLHEADHAYFLDGSEKWQQIRYGTSSRDPLGISVGAVALAAAQVELVLRQLGEVLPPGPVATEAIASARATARLSATLGEWFCRLIAKFCGGIGLPVIDPMQTEMRFLARPGVREVLHASRQIGAALAEGARQIGEFGLSPQLEVNAADANLFYYPDGPEGSRVALVSTATAAGEIEFGLRGRSDQRWTVEQLAALVAEVPERFSGNVVSRPIVQDTLLPTVAYLAGPGEIGYYGMLRGCYAAVGRTMPVIWPRPSATVIEPAMARLLRKRRLEQPQLPASLTTARAEVIQAADSIGIDALFGRLRSAVDGAYAPTLPALADFDEVLGRLAAQNQARVHREIAWLERKSWQVARQRSAEALGQLDRLQTQLWPRHGLQERTACGLGLIATYGLDIVADLAAIDPGPPYVHHFAYLG